MGMINISKIIIDKNVKKNLPTQFSKTEQISTGYTLTKTLRSKIFNHKEFTMTLNTKDILENMKNLPCNCTSQITNPKHGHIVTGDICMVQKNKLRKLLCKGPKYRETVSINFLNCKTEIINNLTKFSPDWCNKKEVPVKCFTQWISLAMKKVKELKNLKTNLNLVKLKQMLKHSKLISYLNILPEQYVMCHFANNIAFICKKYYI